MCQSIWDKSEVLLGTLWGICQELGNSLLGWKIYCPLSKWEVNSGQSTLLTKCNLSKKTSPPQHPQEKKK
jgi:hypothetical protein